MKSTIIERQTGSIGERVRTLRKEQKLTLDQLAQRSGVSRAMISKIERSERNPTAAILGRISVALDVTLSVLLHERPQILSAEGSVPVPVPQVDQNQWRDPGSGYLRRQVIPVNPLGAPELSLISLPVGASVSFPTTTEASRRHAVWVLSGCLCLKSRGLEYNLSKGDAVIMGIPGESTFSNEGPEVCEYVVVVGEVDIN